MWNSLTGVPGNCTNVWKLNKKTREEQKRKTLVLALKHWKSQEVASYSPANQLSFFFLFFLAFFLFFYSCSMQCLLIAIIITAIHPHLTALLFSCKIIFLQWLPYLVRRRLKFGIKNWPQQKRLHTNRKNISHWHIGTMFLDLPADVPITQNILHLALYFLL